MDGQSRHHVFRALALQIHPIMIWGKREKLLGLRFTQGYLWCVSRRRRESWATPFSAVVLWNFARGACVESGSVEWGGVRVRGMTSGACTRSAMQEDVPRGPFLAEVPCGSSPLRNGALARSDDLREGPWRASQRGDW